VSCNNTVDNNTVDMLSCAIGRGYGIAKEGDQGRDDDDGLTPHVFLGTSSRRRRANLLRGKAGTGETAANDDRAQMFPVSEDQVNGKAKQI
jgi:hypothetical protein